MTKEEDDATSALIAQMLMQDQMDNPYLQQVRPAEGEEGEEEGEEEEEAEREMPSRANR